MDLRAFVLFSSVAGVLGGPGQGSYCAANNALDALAALRRSQGRAGTSLAWGLWAVDSAISGHLNESDLARMARGGLVPLGTDEALALLDVGLGTLGSQPVPARIEASRMPTERVPGILRALVRPTLRRAAEAADGGAGLLARLAALPPAERTAALTDVVLRQVSAVLGHSGVAVAADRAFSELGFDSLTAVELRNGLQELTGARLPATLVFDYPTPQALTDRLAEQLLPQLPSASGALLAELDRLDSAIFAGAVEPGAWEAVGKRLQELAAKWLRGGAGDPEEALAAETAQRLDDASDEELFDLIDHEFGVG
jgi:acyl carrier protein